MDVYNGCLIAKLRYNFEFYKYLIEYLCSVVELVEIG